VGYSQGQPPQHLLDTGIKRGDEFDANGYFTVLNHISMQDGYLLDYVYISESLGGSPLLYARPESQDPYASMEDVPDNTQLPDFHGYLKVEDVEQGYFQYVVLNTMGISFTWTGMLYTTTQRSYGMVMRSMPSSRISVMGVLELHLILPDKSKPAR
jgi:hypothetical protein